MPLRPLTAPTGTAWRAAATYPTSEPAPWRAAVAAACPSWPAPVQLNIAADVPLLIIGDSVLPNLTRLLQRALRWYDE